MGTTVGVLLPPGSTRRAGAVRALFTEWEATLSRFRPDSELSALNGVAGREARVSPLLFDVVAASLDAARATEGLFDPTLGARMAELGYDRTFADLPADRPATPRPDACPPAPWVAGRWRGVGIDGRLRTIRLPAGVALDVGGIAKGMAVDASIALLAAEGVAAAAVNAGGDLAVLGLPGEAPAWTIRIETPVDDRPAPVVAITSGGLATSSVGRRRWHADGEARHHLIDPRDGRSARTDAWSVSVPASTCRVAEVAAKVALVLGRALGGAFLRRHGLDGLIIAEDGTARWVDGASATRATGGVARARAR